MEDLILNQIKDGGNVIRRVCSMGAVLLLVLPVAGYPLLAQTPAPVPSTKGDAVVQQTTTPPADAKSTPAQDTAYAGPMDASRYVIGPQDSLQVTVWKEPTLSGTLPVRPDGMISLVLVGDIPAAGLTPTALSNDIGQRLKKYIQDPVVTVVVVAVNSQRVFLVGEVGHVGPITMTPGMTPLQAIVSGGGLTQFASTKRIYILRTAGGKQQKIPYNYKQALKGDNVGVSLLSGDTIVVP